MLVLSLLACGEPSPAPQPVATPVAPVAPVPPAARVAAPPREVEGAEPMRLAADRGPGGEPAKTLNLVVASRGDGEIEPCG
ncbi:MAG: hypothetical protein KC656_02380 [Myxococcales bacterium]|nr:hypothetical protein [Myxococcales bacterium]MCB9672437.1 hypothetical protein [Alphaproteobacteria bacterium]MCB9693056.1 hypothetical protein [Alphaproteobacteria bacterium]